MKKHIYNSMGNWVRTENDGRTEATVCIEGKTDSIEMTEAEYKDVSTGKKVSEAVAKKFFKFMGDNTEVEWGLIKDKNGKSSVMTNHLANHVYPLYYPSETAQITHSHRKSRPDGGTLSKNDKKFAEEEPEIKCTLFYNGQFRDFDQYGFINEPY